MLDLLILIIVSSLMFILTLSPFILGIGFLIWLLHYLMNGKYKETIESIKYYREKRKEKKEAWTVKKDKNGKYILKVGGLRK